MPKNIDTYWTYWIDRATNHGDKTDDGRQIIRARGDHYVVNPRSDGPSSMLGHGGREISFILEDGTVVSSNDVWYQGVVPLTLRRLLPDNADPLSEGHPPPVAVKYDEHVLRSLSAFNHNTYLVNFGRTAGKDADGYETVDVERLESPASIEQANIWSSRISDTDFWGEGFHTVMLDLDVPARLVPSSKQGHWHLYIDVSMPWKTYRKLLKALRNAGVIEDGYYKASVVRKASALRLPWVTKDVE